MDCWVWATAAFIVGTNFGVLLMCIFQVTKPSYAQMRSVLVAVAISRHVLAVHNSLFEECTDWLCVAARKALREAT